MIARALSRFLLVTTLLAVVGLGAASAYGMAPDRDQAARAATLLVMGATADDLCDGGALGHVHDCPLCDKLPSAPDLTAPVRPVDLALSDGFILSHDLLAGPRGQTSHGAPRAPPHTV